LAIYLEELLPEWNVDCEHNRQGQDGQPKKRANGKRVRPDIIVHHRGRLEPEHNLVAIELKRRSSRADDSKAREYTAAPDRYRRFQYQFGLALGLSGPRRLTWFREGREC